ncbi:MAG: DUF4861 domain-containing protein [Prevotella sp.]|nr:DUF4861 domain-containing protein [Prevotella sp.]
MKTISRIYTALALALLFAPITASAETITVSVTNPDNVQRQELISVDAQEVYSKLGINQGEAIIVKNVLGQEVAYQITHDGQLLIDAAVRPKGTAEFTIQQGTPKEMKVSVCGKMYPERVDDVAWENDRTAYRLYGPALQRTGERAFGIDVWLKNTPDLEVDKRYHTELSNHAKIEELKAAGKDDEAFDVEVATTYHFDHGYGLDCYKVGPSLGCGTPALVDDKGIIMPYCYNKYEILDNGPLRFTVQLEYNPFTYGSDENVIEHRLISLDKGSNFNKMTVWFDGLSKPADMVAGVVIHTEDTESVAYGDDYVVYADPTEVPEKQNFQIYVGVLFPNGVKETKGIMLDTPENGIAGHGVGMITYQPDEKYTYYFGSAWSKNDVRTFNEWQLRSTETLSALKNPLKVEIK